MKEDLFIFAAILIVLAIFAAILIVLAPMFIVNYGINNNEDFANMLEDYETEQRFYIFLILAFFLMEGIYWIYPLSEGDKVWDWYSLEYLSIVALFKVLTFMFSAILLLIIITFFLALYVCYLYLDVFLDTLLNFFAVVGCGVIFLILNALKIRKKKGKKKKKVKR